VPPATDGAATVQITSGPSEPRPIYKRWWFWTGIGVVVLGGIVVALSMKQQDPSCPPGRTCQ
jgi:hypothetical protein